MADLDIAAARAARDWSRSEQGARVLWALARPLFRMSPRPLWGWRRWLLRAFGARVGREARVHPSARVTMPWHLSIGDQACVGDGAILYALGRIEIGARATVSQGAHLCAGTHDWRGPGMRLVKAPVTVGPEAWICAEAFVGPGVRVGAGAVLGARAVAMRDVGAGVVAAGNPARAVGKRGRTT